MVKRLTSRSRRGAARHRAPAETTRGDLVCGIRGDGATRPRHRSERRSHPSPSPASAKRGADPTGPPERTAREARNGRCAPGRRGHGRSCCPRHRDAELDGRAAGPARRARAPMRGSGGAACANCRARALARRSATARAPRRRPTRRPTRCSTALRSLSITSMPPAESTIATPSTGAFSDCAPISARTSGRRACIRRISTASRPGGPSTARSRGRWRSNIAAAPRHGAVRFYAEHVQPLPGQRLHRHHQRFHRSRHRARRAAQNREPVSQYLRSGAHRRRVRESARPLSALQRRLLQPARLRRAKSCRCLPMQELTHPEDRAESAANLERLWTGEVPFLDFEKRYRRKDGTFIWVRTTTALVRDGNSAECSVEYLRDITQRRQLTAQLLQQRTLLEAVISDLPVALLACDVSGKITHFNRAAAELHGMRARRAGLVELRLARRGYVSHGRRDPRRRGRTPPGARPARRDHQQPRAHRGSTTRLRRARPCRARAACWVPRVSRSGRWP